MGLSQEKRMREMREIKFRGKSNIYGWVYGTFALIDGSCHIFEKEDLTEDGHHVRQDSDRPTWVEPNTVGQYTGLKDKDGVEIYEGDIVEIHEAPFNFSAIGVVIYDPETARFLIREQNKEYPYVFSFQKNGTYNDGYCRVECESDFHVLGNVHDNPELL